MKIAERVEKAPLERTQTALCCRNADTHRREHELMLTTAFVHWRARAERPHCGSLVHRTKAGTACTCARPRGPASQARSPGV